MAPEETLWQAGAGPKGVSGASFYGRFRRYLACGGLHADRAPRPASLGSEAAHGMPGSRSRRSAPSSTTALAVTTTTCGGSRVETDAAWRAVAAAIGV